MKYPILFFAIINVHCFISTISYYSGPEHKIFTFILANLMLQNSTIFAYTCITMVIFTNMRQEILFFAIYNKYCTDFGGNYFPSQMKSCRLFVCFHCTHNDKSMIFFFTISINSMMRFWTHIFHNKTFLVDETFICSQWIQRKLQAFFIIYQTNSALQSFQ